MPRYVIPRVLLAVALLTVIATSGLGSAAPQAEPRVVNVIVRRFEFDPAVITVAVGEPVRLMVRSEDGVHGMEIKKFKVKKDIPRGGEAVIINFTPNAAGEFPIMCSEYCGDGHEDMRGTLVVQARDTTTNP
jgi:cytochrome c oxidase subunit 2